jgi:hypothetical protein
MFGTFPSLIHSVFSRIPDSEYLYSSVASRLSSHVPYRLRVLIAWLTRDFKSGRRGADLFRPSPYREIKKPLSSTGFKSPVGSFRSK